MVVADAIVKGIKGFDLDTARDAILKDVRPTLPCAVLCCDVMVLALKCTHRLLHHCLLCQGDSV